MFELLLSSLVGVGLWALGWVKIAWAYAIAFSGFVGSSVWQLKAIVSRFLYELWAKTVGVGVPLTGTLLGVGVTIALFGAAVALNLVGVGDVYRTLSSTEGTEAAEQSSEGSDVVERVRTTPTEEYTDERGHFSAETFEVVTGLTPFQFIELFIDHRNGRVKQAALVRCLPWSAGTASQYLSSLERQGRVVRYQLGRENVVALPDAIPEHVPT